MQHIASALRRLLIVLCLLGIAWGVGSNYSYVFSKSIKGEVIEVERVTNPAAMIGGSPMTPDQLFSFAVLIRTFDGKIYSASSEDRQWAIAKKGYCVEARFYPYPPWNLEKADTYFNARLVGVFDCAKEAPAGWTPASSAMGAAPQATGTPSAPAALPTAQPAPSPAAPAH